MVFVFLFLTYFTLYDSLGFPCFVFRWEEGYVLDKGAWPQVSVLAHPGAGTSVPLSWDTVPTGLGLFWCHPSVHWS